MQAGVDLPPKDALFPEPIIIRYDGIDAAGHQIDLALLGTSLQGASRLIGVAAHISLTGVYVSRSPALAVRVLAGQSHDGCYEVPVWLTGMIPILPLLSDQGRQLGKQALEAIVNYILTKQGGSSKAAEMALDTAQQAIAANRDVTLEALQVAKAVVQAGDDQRPASRQFASPVGATVSTATLGDPERAFVVDQNAKAQIEQRPSVDIGPSQQFRVKVSELDIVTGSCKVEIHGDDSGLRIDGDIVDPVVNDPHSPYSAALDAQDWIAVTAKPHIKDGEISKLTISDTAGQ
jgi:hypothetical protein